MTSGRGYPCRARGWLGRQCCACFADTYGTCFAAMYVRVLSVNSPCSRQAPASLLQFSAGSRCSTTWGKSAARSWDCGLDCGEVYFGYLSHDLPVETEVCMYRVIAKAPYLAPRQIRELVPSLVGEVRRSFTDDDE